MISEQGMCISTPIRLRAGLKRASNIIMALEKRLLQCLVFIITAIFLSSVPLQILKSPIFWATEVSVNLMAMLGAVGSSYLIGKGLHPSVTLIDDLVSAKTSAIISLLVNSFIVAYGGAILVISYMWFDPFGVLSYRQDMSAYAADTGNFMYKQTLNTLDFSMAWFWSIWPVSGLAILIHGLDRAIDLLPIIKRGC